MGQRIASIGSVPHRGRCAPAPRATRAPHRRERRIRDLLALADIRVDGFRPWDIEIVDERFVDTVARRGLTGAGDAYIRGWWECEAIDEMFCRALRADLPAAMRWSPYTIGVFLRHSLLNLQARRRAPANGQAHYDRGDELFRAMLDPRMVYSCGYWREGMRTLAEAQEAKLDLICRKLDIRPGVRVLDIGCGWGGFVQFAAEEHGAECVGVTISPAQADAARRRCEGLPVEIELRDYREITGSFDRIVSIGMFEHVGQKNHRAFMRVADRVLADGGLMLLHFFATQRSWPNLLDTEIDWFERNIFPGMVIPSLAQVGRAIDGLFVVEDLHNFGAHYDPTLLAWRRNFEVAWPNLEDGEAFDERFRRMWRFYLLGAAGAFRSRKHQVWQLVLSRQGAPGGYASIR
jgi:cyclopropane-fatty-acyl-phospholipid synthase